MQERLLNHSSNTKDMGGKTATLLPITLRAETLEFDKLSRFRPAPTGKRYLTLPEILRYRSMADPEDPIWGPRGHALALTGNSQEIEGFDRSGYKIIIITHGYGAISKTTLDEAMGENNYYQTDGIRMTMGIEQFWDQMQDVQGKRYEFSQYREISRDPEMQLGTHSVVIRAVPTRTTNCFTPYHDARNDPLTIARAGGVASLESFLRAAEKRYMTSSILFHSHSLVEAKEGQAVATFLHTQGDTGLIAHQPYGEPFRFLMA